MTRRTSFSNTNFPVIRENSRRIFWTLIPICSSFVLMKDYGAKYRQVTHFGLFADESADRYGQTDAWNILVNALLRTMYEDVRSDELESALGYLQSSAIRDRPFRDFREALNIGDPFQRVMTAREAAQRIRKALTA